MPLFRKDRSPGRISAFWDWWVREGREQATASIGGGLEPERFAAAMTAKVRTVGPLAWSLTAGDGTSDHVLVVSAEGDPALRALARRTLLAAPAADAVWSYLDARPPAADPEAVVLGWGETLDLDLDLALDLARVTVGARLAGSRFDVQVHHPAFADLPHPSRQQLAFLALDAALGEVDTELWLGEVHAAEVPPLDGFGLSALRAVVLDLKGRHVDEDGHLRWTVLRGEVSGSPVVAAARVPLHPLTAPLLDTYVAVVLPYVHRTADGLPGDGSAEELHAFEERLVAELGTSGALVAHQSVAGVRTMHLYVDSTAGLVPVVRRLATSWSQGPVSVHDSPDPGWDSVRHLRP